MTDTKLITDGLRRNVRPMFIDHESSQCHDPIAHIQKTGLDVNSQVCAGNGFTVDHGELPD
jgi:hypothetical protein